jgi:hypothetical protein
MSMFSQSSAVSSPSCASACTSVSDVVEI